MPITGIFACWWWTITRSTGACCPISCHPLGYQVITANDGVDALSVLERNAVDIVLTDVNMPNMDGYELTRCLRQSNFIAPVIGVTANALAEEKQRCLEAGMDNCLSKPVTLETLEQSLGYYSQRVRRLRAESQTVYKY
ncbi:Sensor kinase protein RcsC [Serratia fonticola]|uniref:Sensor kinase protein RcsC n=1 Tax=Serratia fonticola TaxID=47917 RepID=A0A4U9UAD1_SERFO|nr:Sensor kinase protein RcsC [Serratia fonticola]